MTDTTQVSDDNGGPNYQAPPLHAPLAGVITNHLDPTDLATRWIESTTEYDWADLPPGLRIQLTDAVRTLHAWHLNQQQP